MCRNFSFSIVFPEKAKALQTFDTKGFEVLFGWFKLYLSEPYYVPGGIRTPALYEELVLQLIA